MYATIVFIVYENRYSDSVIACRPCIVCTLIILILHTGQDSQAQAEQSRGRLVFGNHSVLQSV